MCPKYKKGKNLIWEKYLPKSKFSNGGGRERERIHVSFDGFSGFVNRKSSSPELKLFVSTRAMRRHQKRGISPKIHRRGFGEIEGFKFRKCFKASYGFYYAPRGGDYSYFGLFSIIGAVWLSFNALRGCLTVFSLRGCLAK